MNRDARHATEQGSITRAEKPATEGNSRRGVRTRWKVLLTLAVLTIGAGLAYREFWLKFPVGTGPAGPEVERSAFANIWSDRKVHVFGAGDSITAGLGAKRNDHRFFDRLITCPDDEFPAMKGVCLSAVFPNLTFDNTAVSGSNSLDHLDALKEHLPTFPDDTLGIVILTTGGNDLIHWYGTRPPREGAMYGATFDQAQPWVASYERRLNEMLDLLIERFPGGCQIFIGDIYDPTDGVGDAPSAYLPAWPDALKIHRQYNLIIHLAAEDRSEVHVVPLYKTFLGHGLHCRQFWRESYCRRDPTYWYYGNIEDPNDRGHDAVRRAFLNAIVRAPFGQKTGQLDNEKTRLPTAKK